MPPDDFYATASHIGNLTPPPPFPPRGSRRNSIATYQTQLSERFLFRKGNIPPTGGPLLHRFVCEGEKERSRERERERPTRRPEIPR